MVFKSSRHHRAGDENPRAYFSPWMSVRLPRHGKSYDRDILSHSILVVVLHLNKIWKAAVSHPELRIFTISEIHSQFTSVYICLHNLRDWDHVVDMLDQMYTYMHIGKIIVFRYLNYTK
jgi:hypothetical protein